MSKAVVVQYRTRADGAESNRRLIAAVFEELHDARPAGLSYTAFALEDGVGFLHVVLSESDEDVLERSVAFQKFQENLAERLVGPPEFTPMTVLGSYGAMER